jgi:cytochrome c5
MLGRLTLLVGLLWVAGCGGGESSGSPAKPLAPGEQTYLRFCISCHSSGVTGAPPVGNAKAWAPRIAQGDDVMLKNTIDGLPSAGMPPRGMCVACTDQELQDAIHYMTSRSR